MIWVVGENRDGGTDLKRISVSERFASTCDVYTMFADDGDDGNTQDGFWCPKDIAASIQFFDSNWADLPHSLTGVDTPTLVKHVEAADYLGNVKALDTLACELASRLEGLSVNDMAAELGEDRSPETACDEVNWLIPLHRVRPWPT